eukprot:359882-Chlamydomonas_euryale.AAC.1
MCGWLWEGWGGGFEIRGWLADWPCWKWAGWLSGCGWLSMCGWVTRGGWGRVVVLTQTWRN